MEAAGDGSGGLSSTKPVQSLEWIIANFSRSNASWPQGSTIIYSFRESLPPTSDTDITFEAYNPTERMFARMGFDLISDICNLKFVEAPDDGVETKLSNRIYFGHDTTREPEGVWGYALRSGGSKISAAAIWTYTETVDLRAWIVGGLNFQTLMHEQLHTLGISHPGNYDILSGEKITFATHAQYAQDSGQFTLMSYFGASNTGSDHTADSFGGPYSSATPQLHDVAVLQALYGANMNTRTGDTVYGYNSNTGRPSYTLAPGSTTADTTVNSVPIFCIWDAGGTDLIDFSLTGFAVNLDLRAGHFSDAFEMTNNISIAFGVTIENAITGSGADRILGNDANNLLRGGAGDDMLEGAAGDDFLEGQLGDDRLFGGGGDDLVGGQIGADYLSGGTGRDQLYGDAGADFLEGGADDDRQFGQDGDDLIGGQDGADYLSGGAGRDQLYGDAGADFLEGGADDDRQFGQDGDDLMGGQDGADYLSGGTGRDQLYGDAGADFLEGGADDDRQFGQEGDDLMGGQDGDDLLDGGAGADALYGDSGADTLFGGGGRDQLFGQAGADRFVFTSVSESGVGAADRVGDFDWNTGDVIDLSAIDADVSASGDQGFAIVSSFTGRAGEATLGFDAAAGVSTLRLDVNGDGSADFELLIGGDVGDGSQGFML